MKAYSMDLRTRVIADCDAGLATGQVAAKYRVSESWVRRLKQRRRESGTIAPKPAGGKRHSKIDLSRLEQLVDEQPDATLAELRERLGISCGLSAMCKATKKLRLSYRKNAPRQRTKPARRRGLPVVVGVDDALRVRPRPHDLPRRNMGQDEYDAAAGAVSQRATLVC